MGKQSTMLENWSVKAAYWVQQSVRTHSEQ